MREIFQKFGEMDFLFREALWGGGLLAESLWPAELGAVWEGGGLLQRLRRRAEGRAEGKAAG